MDRTLANLEDPVERHVAPPLAPGMGLMLPPSALPGGGGKRKRKVLEEEEYVETLSRIIERDYFPQLAAARGTNSVAAAAGTDDEGLTVTTFFERFTSYDNDSFDTLQEQSVAEHRRKYHWVYELEDGSALDGEEARRRKPGMLMLYYLGNNVLSAQQREQMDAILDGAKEEKVGDNRPNGVQLGKFRVRNQLMFPPELSASEDTCGMNDQLNGNSSGFNSGKSALKSILPVGGSGNETKLLTDGRDLNTSSNNIAALHRAVARYNHRVRSSDSVVSGAEKTIVRANTGFSEEAAAALEGGGLTAAQLLQWERAHRNSGLSMRPAVRHGLVLEEPHTPSLRSSDAQSETSRGSSGDYNHEGRRSYEVVPMSPCPEPGQGALGSLTPLFTWGDVEESPLFLGHVAAPAASSSSGSLLSRASAAAGGGKGSVDARQEAQRRALQAQALREVEEGAPRFDLRPTSKRELLARQLDAHSSSTPHRRVADSTATASMAGTPATRRSERRGSSSDWDDSSSIMTGARSSATAVSGRTHRGAVGSGGSSSNLSQKQRLASLTPAARALAEKLAATKAKQT